MKLRTCPGTSIATGRFAVNLYDNVRRLELDVRRVAALHGPGVAPMADLQSAVGQITGTR